MVKHAVYIALVGGQELQKENTINSLIISSVPHDITFYVICVWHLGLSYAENEVGIKGKGAFSNIKKIKASFIIFVLCLKKIQFHLAQAIKKFFSPWRRYVEFSLT